MLLSPSPHQTQAQSAFMRDDSTIIHSLSFTLFRIDLVYSWCRQGLSNSTGISASTVLLFFSFFLYISFFSPTFGGVGGEVRVGRGSETHEVGIQFSPTHTEALKEVFSANH